MATVAQGLIGTLIDRGWKVGDIAAYVGRDPSAIRQAFTPNAKGYIKPAANMVPALERAVSSGKGPSGRFTLSSANVPRRAQRLREGLQRVGTGEKPAIHRTSGGNEDIKHTLEQAAKEGKRVQFTGDFGNVKRKGRSGGRVGRPPAGKRRQEKRADVPIFQKGGWDAQKALDQINNPPAGATWKAGDARGWLRATAQKEGNIAHVGRFNKVEIHAYNPS